MNIGIAAPIEIASLKNHLPSLTDADGKLGLGGTAVNILIDGFIKQGHTVTVFTLDPSIKKKYVIVGPNLKIIIGHFRSSSRFSNLGKMLDFHRYEFIQIRNFILQEKEQIDIVNAHWSYEFAIGAILAKVPHLVTFRDHAQTILKLLKHPYRFVRLLMDGWVRKHGQHFSYNSIYLKSLIGLNGEVIPNPIRDEDILVPRKFPAGKKKIKICYIANGWDYRKNPEAALEAFSIVYKNFPNIELHLIGHGFSANGEKFDTICAKGWNNGVTFRGAMNHNQLMEELKHFDIMLHTAREESFGNNLTEAMAKGIPVVAGNTSGAVPWVLDNGFAGCLTDIENPAQIAKDLEKLLTEPGYYETLSRNGIENLKARFVQDKVCAAYVNEYKKIISR